MHDKPSSALCRSPARSYGSHLSKYLAVISRIPDIGCVCVFLQLAPTAPAGRLTKDGVGQSNRNECLKPVTSGRQHHPPAHKKNTGLLIVLPRGLDDILRVVQDRVPGVLAHVVRSTVTWKIDRHNLEAFLRGRVEHGISADGRTRGSERGGGGVGRQLLSRSEHKKLIYQDTHGE